MIQRLPFVLLLLSMLMACRPAERKTNQLRLESEKFHAPLSSVSPLVVIDTSEPAPNGLVAGTLYELSLKDDMLVGLSGFSSYNSLKVDLQAGQASSPLRINDGIFPFPESFSRSYISDQKSAQTDNYVFEVREAYNGYTNNETVQYYISRFRKSAIESDLNSPSLTVQLPNTQTTTSHSYAGLMAKDDKVIAWAYDDSADSLKFFHYNQDLQLLGQTTLQAMFDNYSSQPLTSSCHSEIRQFGSVDIVRANPSLSHLVFSRNEGRCVVVIETENLEMVFYVGNFVHYKTTDITDNKLIYVTSPYQGANYEKQTIHSYDIANNQFIAGPSHTLDLTQYQYIRSKQIKLSPNGDRLALMLTKSRAHNFLAVFEYPSMTRLYVERFSNPQDDVETYSGNSGRALLWPSNDHLLALHKGGDSLDEVTSYRVSNGDFYKSSVLNGNGMISWGNTGYALSDSYFAVQYRGCQFQSLCFVRGRVEVYQLSDL